MQIEPGTATRQRSIGAKDGPSFTVNVPTPYAAGYVCDEAHANILNQTLAENVSNNLRAKLIEGRPEVKDEAGNVTEAARPYTDAEAQALVDSYVADYEPGVRRGGGEARIVDPVEREALAIAKEKAKELVRSKGGKPSDFDIPTLGAKILEANRDFLMAEAKKIVDARNKASKKSDEGLSFDGIDLAPKAAAA
jgi:hypothetical protein